MCQSSLRVWSESFTKPPADCMSPGLVISIISAVGALSVKWTNEYTHVYSFPVAAMIKYHRVVLNGTRIVFQLKQHTFIISYFWSRNLMQILLDGNW